MQEEVKAYHKVDKNLVSRTKNAEMRRLRVAHYLMRGYSYNQIAELVKKDLDLNHLCKATVCKDAKALLKEWREQKDIDVESAVSLELQRIDTMVSECWEAWEKSKKDYQEHSSSRRGVPNGANDVTTISLQSNVRDVTKFGDVRYMEMINRLLQERRKILGLYAPEKKDISGGISFEQLLIEAGTKTSEE